MRGGQYPTEKNFFVRLQRQRRPGYTTWGCEWWPLGLLPDWVVVRQYARYMPEGLPLFRSGELVGVLLRAILPEF